VFVECGDTRAHFELNFSPSSEWAIYRFDDYRRGMQAGEPQNPPTIVRWRRENLPETQNGPAPGNIVAGSNDAC
jgi:hypothetical protein